MDEQEVVWRDSARPVRVLGLDARLLAIGLVWVLWPSWLTTALVLVAFMAFRIAEARGYRVQAAVRGLRAWTAGSAARGPFRAAIGGLWPGDGVRGDGRPGHGGVRLCARRTPVRGR